MTPSTRLSNITRIFDPEGFEEAVVRALNVGGARLNNFTDAEAEAVQTDAQTAKDLLDQVQRDPDSARQIVESCDVENAYRQGCFLRDPSFRRRSRRRRIHDGQRHSAISGSDVRLKRNEAGRKDGRMGSFQDLTGQKFGMLEVISFAAKQPTSRWHCRCECGRSSVVESRNLKTGNTKSCGCKRSAVGRANFKDLTGQRFGRLQVVSLASRNPTRWNCRCDCGQSKVVSRGELLKDSTKIMRLSEARTRKTLPE